MRRTAAAARALLGAPLAAIVALAPAITAFAGPGPSEPGASSTPAARAVATATPAGMTRPRGDPLESAECQRTVAALNADEAAVAESSRARGSVTANDRRLIDARLAPVRRHAATACLARRADPASLSAERLMRPPPVAAAPVVVAPGSSPAPAATTARAAPPAPTAAPPERPYAITSCDSGGCWANDGSRLNRVGPNLWGPRGVCTVQGSLVQCP